MDSFKSFNEFRKEEHEREQHLVQVGQLREDRNPLPGGPGVEEPPVPAPVRRKGKRRRKKHGHSASPVKHYVIGGLAVVAVVLVVLFFFPVPLGYIHLTGTNTLTVEDVMLDGNIRQPVNVLQISSSDLKERLSHDIRVEDAQVARSFPFVLEVNIIDRVPLAVVQGEYSYAFVDKNGMVMNTAVSIRGTDVPMITGKKLGNLLLGDTIDESDVGEALTFLNSLTPEGLSVFSEINIGNEEQIRAYTRDGITVRLGDGSDMEKRAKLAEDMVGDVKARGLSVEYLDANLGSPFIKLKK